MRILITGANGFLGKHVVKELKDEHELLTPSRREFDLVDNGAEYEYQPFDRVRRYLMINKIDAIIHLAATVAGLPGNIGNQGLFMYDNLQMALNIFEGARLANVNKIINLGSVCGYHDVGPKPFKEENYWLGLPHESNRGYGMAKRASIMLGIEYARQYNMDVTNLIPINLVGEYDQSDHVCIDLIRKFEQAHGDPVVLWGSGKATREFCYAGDAARAIGIALKRNTTAWPINIGTSQEISIEDLANLIKKLGNYSSNIIWDKSKPEGQNSRCLDITKAKNVLRWEPTTSLESALLKTIKWYKNEQV